MTIKFSQIFQLLFLFITVASVRSSTNLNIDSIIFWWTVDVFMILLLVLLKPLYFNKTNNNSVIWPIKLFTLWNIICIVLGVYIAEYYWDYKRLISTGLVLLLPLTIYVFTSKVFVQKLISFWLKYGLPLFFIFLPFVIYSDFSGRYLVPVMFLLLVYPLLPFKWKLITLFFTMIVFISGLDARSNIVRFSVAIILGMLYYQRFLIRPWMLKTVHALFLALPIMLFFLATNNVFNVFKFDTYIEGEFNVAETGQNQVSDLKADTRTFIYIESIKSAINNDYIFFGRTPARGYDSTHFGEHSLYELNTNRMERHSSEVAIINIFTWTGITGVILYFLVFFMASSLAVYKSNSFFMKIIGLFVAFRWSYAFVEDFTMFDIQYVFIWLLIGICYSYEFRKMNDKEFKYWVIGIFKRRGNE